MKKAGLELRFFSILISFNYGRERMALLKRHVRGRHFLGNSP